MCVVNEKLEQLFLNNAPRLVGWFINHHKDAVLYFDTFEDMKQELLMRVWQLRPSFDETISKFSTYVVVICKSEISHRKTNAKRLKRRGCSHTISLSSEIGEGLSLMDIISNNEDISDSLARKEGYQKLIDLLKRETYLHYIEGYKYKEISEMTGKSVGYVNQIIRRNISKIKEERNREDL